MAKKITIQIPEPCHEDWNKMTPQGLGKHCDTCEKVVVDFSGKTDVYIAKYLRNHNTICGRFNGTQLNRPIDLAQRRHSLIPPLAASFILPLAMLATTSAYSQGAVKSFKKTSSGYVSLNIGAKQLGQYKDIKGVVKDTAGNPLAGVRIRVKESNDQIQTDLNGTYRLRVRTGQTLHFSYYLFLDEEIVVNDFQDVYDFVLEKDHLTLPQNEVDETEVIEGIPTVGRIAVESTSMSCEFDPELLLTGKAVKVEEPKEDEEVKDILIEDVSTKLDSLRNDLFKPIKISGTVTDGLGQAMPDVQILIKGTLIGTTTDFDGHYTIEVKPGNTLLYSLVGFQQAQIQTQKSSKIIDVALDLQPLPGDDFILGIIVIEDVTENHPKDVRTAYNPSVNYNPDPEKETRKKAYANTVAFKRLQQEKKKASRKARQKSK